ncbi:Protein of unknown function [Mesorhizobium albiziae]|jgi:hypothetical protein|uniref:DUF982 domain-containing protein n=1 Tax=Neomesorhizobium albiziae TaxID=335020 RepID=A0A1I4EXG0_9HYPH|nr:DUF982 domain-containing protein [Mesorhizobium albiziae]GLS32679.1 hypothetical protein GCM10007937_43890 [Mesorhizobium albiziae]SFL09216.1 Protein of unknown function [Mesorhizobium albiziae]
MDELQFFVPVRVVPEPGQPVTEIYGVEEALIFLRNWPSGRQGPVYKAAFNCCSGAMDGMIKPDDARKSFANFARITGILANDAFEKIAINKDGEVLPLPSQY